MTQSPGRDDSSLEHDPAVELTMVAGGHSEHLTLSEIGSIARIDADADAGSPPMEAVVDYQTGKVLIEDVTNRTYSAITLAEYVSKQQPSVSSEGTIQPLPAQSVERTRLRAKIAGLGAHAYLATANGVTTRLWYSEDLPLPPPNVRRELVGIGPLASADADAGDAGGGEHPEEGEGYCSRGPDNDCADRDHAGALNRTASDDECPVRAAELAGRTILRTETQDTAGKWTVTNDTIAAKSSHLAPQDLALPSGFTVKPLPSLPSTVNQAFNDPIACSASGDPSTAVGYSGGIVLQSAHIYVNYFGSGFATAALDDPAGFESVFNAGISLPFSAPYLSGLQQYGVNAGQVVQTRIFGAAPPGAFNDFLIDETGVENLQNSGVVPSLWWSWDSAPLVFLVYDDIAAPSAGGAGYHLAAPSSSWLYLPFPLNLAAVPLIPYAAVVVPRAALSVTAATLALRDQESCGQSRTEPNASCGSIQALDQGTEAMSHELVEAVTDPFPFSGWANAGLFPPWYDGEIADICDSSCPNGSAPDRITRLGNTVLSTYWSNSTGACIPAWPNQVEIVAPSSGALYSLGRANTSGIPVEVNVSNPVDQGASLIKAVTWSVDGERAPFLSPTLTGTEVAASVLVSSAGTHTITATYLSASDSVTVTVRASGPVVTIDSPADGTTVPVGTTMTLAGYGTSLDFLNGIPDYGLNWYMDNVVLGYGSTLTTTLDRAGDRVISLESEDNAGLVGTATITLHVVEPANGPSVEITSPANGFAPPWSITFACNDNPFTCPVTVTFVAQATNPDGTAIDPSQIQWSDPQDGSLGTGASITHTFNVLPCVSTSAAVTAAVAGPNGTSTDSVTISFVSHGC